MELQNKQITIDGTPFSYDQWTGGKYYQNGKLYEFTIADSYQENGDYHSILVTWVEDEPTNSPIDLLIIEEEIIKQYQN